MKRRKRSKSQRHADAAEAARLSREHVSQGMDEEALGDVTIEELREFLEADLVDVPVDPQFKERLRERLWDLVKNRASRPRH